MDVKQTTNKIVQVATIAGAAVLALKSGQSLLKVKDIKSAAMPVISLLVAVSAFNYAYKTPLKVVKS